jgi:hypothetical protein
VKFGRSLRHDGSAKRIRFGWHEARKNSRREEK